MSSSDQWVAHNLQRQRKILEEKQKQRRLQSGGVQSVNRNSFSQAEQQHFFSNTSENSALHRSASTNIIGQQWQQQQQQVLQRQNLESASASRPSTRNSMYSFVNVNNNSSAQRNQSPSDYNSLFSSGTAFGQQQNQNGLSNRGEEPKIITVKGITPPQSRKESLSSDELLDARGSKDILGIYSKKKPVVLNIEHRLESFSRNSDNSALLNSSETEDDSNLQLGPGHGNQNQSLRILHGNQQRSPSSTTALASQRPSWNDDYEDDAEGSIPTEIMDDVGGPVEICDIINNLDQFVLEPVKKHLTLKCKITRDKKGMDKGMFPIYYLHLEKADGKRVFLLAARRRKKSATANYLLSTDPTDLSRNARSFVAKVRSNAMGTQFTIYDNGENPKKASVIGEGIRQELAGVVYDTNVLGLKGPRKMTIVIPGIYVDQKNGYVRPLSIRPICEKDTILERLRNHRLDEMVVLNNKQPVWNEDTQSYVLNFHGRVTQASVKNFQIVHSLSAEQANSASNNFQPEQNEYIIMQFGRIDNETFTMDLRYPLSPVQAFGIAMTSFHGKLACE